MLSVKTDLTKILSAAELTPGDVLLFSPKRSDDTYVFIVVALVPQSYEDFDGESESFLGMVIHCMSVDKFADDPLLDQQRLSYFRRDLKKKLLSPLNNDCQFFSSESTLSSDH